MKFNISKLRLALIVPALALTVLLSGCPVSPGSKAPGFLEVGRYYDAVSAEGNSFRFKVLEIRDDGWIKVEPHFPVEEFEAIWLNTAQVHTIYLRERPAW